MKSKLLSSRNEETGVDHQKAWQNIKLIYIMIKYLLKAPYFRNSHAPVRGPQGTTPPSQVLPRPWFLWVSTKITAIPCIVGFGQATPSPMFRDNETNMTGSSTLVPSYYPSIETAHSSWNNPLPNPRFGKGLPVLHIQASRYWAGGNVYNHTLPRLMRSINQ